MRYVHTRFSGTKFLDLAEDLVTRWWEEKHHLNFHGDAMATKTDSTSMTLFPLKKETLQQQSAVINRSY
jgi:hypothetical protein